ncbi:dihydrofolate reductase [Colletotrichum liriopes]|uniref:Dihydrofolate reductase n=1 Tax=Colletotrichum liriopes TaxID=708192 RepID=A0AA37LWD7_9PEZI|nr:dihydrofolate reductase [Colletotrichum liriopes]
MSHELTLIVAATRNMGIGAKGGLPWTGLKKEMAYFARVTKRLPPQGRLNIVISRSHPAPDSASAPDPEKEPVKVGSLEQALAYLRADGVAGRLGKVFVIGGAQIYDAALRAPEAKRVLLTKVLADFECDAFFPLRLSDEGEVAEGWRKAEKSELDAWAGEEVEGGEIEENGARYEFQMWEKA